MGVSYLPAVAAATRVLEKRLHLKTHQKHLYYGRRLRVERENNPIRLGATLVVYNYKSNVNVYKFR